MSLFTGQPRFFAFVKRPIGILKEARYNNVKILRLSIWRAKYDMPTYVYGCDACGHQFEQFQKFSDEPIRICPLCAKNVRRIFQPAGIVFKGSGWHITDYKRSTNNGSNGNGESKAGKNGESTATESKSESGSAGTESKSEPVSTAAPDAA